MRDRSVGWDGKIAAYANNQRRHIFDAKRLQYLLIEAGGIALAILCGLDNHIGNDLRHGRPKISKRFAGMVESLAHGQGRGVVEPNVLVRIGCHGDLPKRERERRSVSQSRGVKLFRSCSGLFRRVGARFDPDQHDLVIAVVQ